MEVWNTDGTRETLSSEQTFHYSYDGPIRYADLFYGECVDARQDDGDPSVSAYQERGWKTVNEKQEAAELPVAQCDPEVEVFAEVPAKSIITTPNGDTVVDFGQNMAGTIRVVISADPGEQIEFEHG